MDQSEYPLAPGRGWYCHPHVPDKEMMSSKNKAEGPGTSKTNQRFWPLLRTTPVLSSDSLQEGYRFRD